MFLFKWLKSVFLKEFSKGDRVSTLHRGQVVCGTIEKYAYDKAEKCVYYKVILDETKACFWKKGYELILRKQ